MNINGVINISIHPKALKDPVVIPDPVPGLVVTLPPCSWGVMKTLSSSLFPSLSVNERKRLGESLGERKKVLERDLKIKRASLGERARERLCEILILRVLKEPFHVRACLCHTIFYVVQNCDQH